MASCGPDVRGGQPKVRGHLTGAPDHLWVISSTSDADGRSTRVDPQWLALTGQTAEEALGYGWLDAVHPLDRPGLIKALQATLQRRDVLRHEFRILGKDGRNRWALGVAAPRFDETGKFLGYAASLVDIHDRREIEESLKKTEEEARLAHERLTATLRASPIVVFEQGGPDLRYRWLLNPPPGVRSENVVGKTDHDLLRGQDADLLLSIKRQAIETGASVRQEVRIYVEDEPRWYDLNVEPHRIDGVIDGILGTASDVTNRKRAESALRRTQETLALAVDAAQMGTWDVDLRLGGAVVRNLRHDQIFGYPTLQDKWTFNDARQHMLEVDRPIFDAALEDARRTGKVEFEVRIRKPDGSVNWMASRGRMTFDREGNLIRASGVNFDVTTQKAAEQQQKEADRRKDEFLAILGHELRNPLTPIQNGVQAMKRALRPDATDGERALLDMMQRQTGYLVRLVDDLLQLSRVNSGVIALDREPADLAAAVRDALEVVGPLIEKKGHEVTALLPDAPLIVNGDPMRLAQIVTNLLSNAAKYTAPGGHIDILAERREGMATIRVNDNGVGIKSTALPRVFDLFSQIDEPDLRAGGVSEDGLGVGLALAKKLVTLHGGTIEAASAGLGKGSQFAVNLPLEETQPIEAEQQREDAPEAPRALKLLVIDDNHDVADSMAMLLESFGGEIRVSYDGAAGVEAAAEFRPNVAFVDLRMPGIDGYETARRIRGRLGHHTPRLVALSGIGDREGSREAGFDIHLTKPVSVEALEALLSETARYGAAAVTRG